MQNYPNCKDCNKKPGDYRSERFDYNKLNCDESNLITLCRACNVKVNFKREIWQRLFKTKTQGEYS